MTLALTLLHTFWGVVFFEGCEKRRWWGIGVVVVLHLIVSCLVSTYTRANINTTPTTHTTRHSEHTQPTTGMAPQSLIQSLLTVVSFFSWLPLMRALPLKRGRNRST